MGILLSLSGGRFAPAVSISLDSPPPSPEEREVCSVLDNQLLGASAALQSRIDGYSSASKETQKAMSEASEATEIACFTKLLEMVDSIHAFFRFANLLQETIPSIYDVLCRVHSIRGGFSDQKDMKDAASKEFATKQAVAARLVHLLAFAFAFDQVRIARPFVSNDFSYYRRMLPKYSIHPVTRDQVRVHDDEASLMALFTARYNPMFFAFVEGSKSAVARTGQPLASVLAGQGLADDEEAKASDLDGGFSSGASSSSSSSAAGGIGGGAHAVEVLATVANSCLEMLKDKKDAGGKDPATRLMLARAMAMATTIYDNVCDAGAFSKRSTVRTKDIIQYLKSDFAQEPALLSLIKFSAKTLNDAPSNIQELLEDV